MYLHLLYKTSLYFLSSIYKQILRLYVCLILKELSTELKRLFILKIIQYLIFISIWQDNVKKIICCKKLSFIMEAIFKNHISSLFNF